MKIGDLIEADYNPRQLSSEQFEDLKKSIEKFGFVDPIIINSNKDRKNIVVGGHQRLKIAKMMDMNTVPCFKVNLPLKDERELNIRLNKNNGEWNYDDLANHFDVDDLLEWGFKDYELGFEKREDIDYDELWEGMPEYDNEDITPYRTLYVHFRMVEKC